MNAIDGITYLGRTVKPGERWRFSSGGKSIDVHVVELVPHSRQVHLRLGGQPLTLDSGEVTAFAVGGHTATVKVRVDGERFRVAFGATKAVRFDRVRGATTIESSTPTAADSKPIHVRRRKPA